MATTYGRCNQCGVINWDSPTALREFGYGCRKCASNQTRYSGKLSLFERIYLLRRYWWETNMKNQSLCDGDPDPNWYWNPKNLLAVFKEFRRETTQASS